ncbi:YceD family protein [Ralstonia solanacearum]|uniref:YceD family protein n=1 Tax=Ralstonia solanacearum TaxID=305 RepID=UPI00078EC7D5|nr:YceD family protein [Ralstonia solanacearum]AMP38113.1 metal-binding protein [Ralstonia solanacearum]AXV86940.1 metal-binding protein [Ralstonia solanacearum]AXW06437.1 metal-binding protein [Ralstonia solanacearum]AXW24180.1 metal-binding protein [Ralstonia solanacearum]AXW81115.1 metal-binding protein [Ralstonia solanacearum]
MDFRAFDLFAFIRGGEQASGSVGLTDMPRLLAEQAADAPANAGNLFRWQMRGVVRDEAVAAGQSPRQRLLVDLEVDGAVWLQCQRCLRAYEQPLPVRTRLEVVRSEAEADAAPLDDDEADVVVGSRSFDLIAQIEDELLLALPVSPRHEICPDAVEPEAAEAEKKPSPFAVLANLKTKH